MSAASRLDFETQKNGFRLLLEQGLQVSANDQIVVLHDETMAPYLRALVSAIVTRDLSAAFINIPKIHQEYLCAKMLVQPNQLWLPQPLVTALNTSTVIINVLNGDIATAPVRRAILALQRSGSSRLAHIPGLSDDILAITGQTDFEAVYAASELVAWALGNGQCAELRTFDHAGNEHCLGFDLGGWDNEPLMSPGIIVPGSWGNFPPGETFCCPDPPSVNGTVCINGSVPNYVMKPPEEVVLQFESGYLTKWMGNAFDGGGHSFFNEQQRAARMLGDKNWNILCELGIGLNAAVKNLTGNGLFDEKMAGTVHVAIGDNTAFGHNVEASIHADLVVKNPSLLIDGTTIIDRGDLCADAIRQMREAWNPPATSIPENLVLRVKAAELKVRSELLNRRLCKGNRLGFVQMANISRSRALAGLLHVLVHGEPITAGQFVGQYPTFEGYRTEELLAILQHYRCLNKSFGG